MRMLKENRKAQDEMVGFGLIIVMVAVIFLVIISVYLRKPQEKNIDYQANSFVQAVLQYTTTCEEESGNLTIQDLMSKCKEGNPCYYNELIHQESNPCKILNDTLKEIVATSWKTGTNQPIKGYSFKMNISEDGQTEEQFLNIEDGVVTKNYKIGEQDLPPMRGDWEYATIIFNLYS